MPACTMDSNCSREIRVTGLPGGPGSARRLREVFDGWRYAVLPLAQLVPGDRASDPLHRVAIPPRSPRPLVPVAIGIEVKAPRRCHQRSAAEQDLQRFHGGYAGAELAGHDGGGPTPC